MASKSLLYDSNMHIFKYRKSTKSDVLAYEIIAIDKDDGPYTCSTNEHKVDVIYHSHNPIYSISVANILEEKEMVPIHDCILYNKYKWSSLFRNWFESKCIRIAPRGALNSIIFQSNKFILITWLAPKDTLFAYPGYEKSVSVCGGLAIDANKIIDEKLQFVFENETIWYIDAGESFDTIADGNKSIIDKVHCIIEHTKTLRSIEVLQVALRQAPRKLKLTKYGKRFYYATTVPVFIWNDYLVTGLHRFNVTTTKTGKTVRWNMGYGVADCIFKLPFFTKTYSDSFDNSDIVVFSSNIKASINLTSGRMIFKGYILKLTNEGTFGLSCLPKECRQEFWISLLDISSSLRMIILNFLSISDLLICKNVSAELAVECLEKLNGN